jgi:hypothetical protein
MQVIPPAFNNKAVLTGNFLFPSLIEQDAKNQTFSQP